MHISMNQIHVDENNNIVFAFMADGLLSSPEALKATEVTDESLSFSWNAVDNAESYEVVLSSDKGTEYADTVTSTTVTFSSLESDKAYTMTIKALAETYVDSDPASVDAKTLVSGISKLVNDWGGNEVEAFNAAGVRIGKAPMSSWQNDSRLKPGIYLFRMNGATRKAYYGK